MPHLEICVDWPLEFSDVLGIVPDDFYRFECATAEYPLRSTLNASGDWVYTNLVPQLLTQSYTPSASDEREADASRRLLSPPIPPRITPCGRNSTVKNIERDKWYALTQAIETLEEYGSFRDQDDAKVCVDLISQTPDLRNGRKFHHRIDWGGPKVLRHEIFS